MNKAPTTDAADVGPQAVQFRPIAAAPFEPPVNQPGTADARQTLIDLTRFVAHGGDHLEAVPDDAWPAAMHRHRDLSAYRLPFPLVLPREGRIQSLAERIDAIVDELVAVDELEGDAVERARHDLRRAENALRRDESALKQPLTLSQAWKAAAQALLAEEPASSRDRLADNLTRANKLMGDTDVLEGLSSGTARRLTRHLLRSWLGDANADWHAEMDNLAESLAAKLRAEQDRRPEARNPDRLAQSVGPADADDLDFAALSDILGRSDPGQGMPQERLERITTLATSLHKARQRCRRIDEAGLPCFDGNLEAAIASGQRELADMAALVRDVEKARLELENRYRADQLDGLFASFDADQLDAEQRARCQPTIVFLGASDVQAQLPSLLDVLGSPLPVKVVIEFGIDALDPTHWTARLASALVGLGRAFVFQGSLADPTRFADNLERALAFAGPALLVMHRPDDEAPLPTFLQAAAASESRLLPTFRFDPSAGNDLAAQAQLMDTPAPEAAWSTEAFAYTDARGEQQSVELPFTIADLLAAAPAYRRHFGCVPPSHWHPAMQRLDEFLSSDDVDRDERVPYLILVGPTGELVRVAPDRHIIEVLRSCQRHWRWLQEICGVASSHVAHAMAREQDQMRAERDQAIESVRRDYDQQLEQDVAELGRQIVANIADRLLAADGSVAGPLNPVAMTAPAPTRQGAMEETPAPATEEPPAQESDEAEEPEVELVMDEPYIDTPLCTTCDDCTTINAELFGYDENKQAYIKDSSAGSFQELVLAAEKCPVSIIHPGKPADPNEPDLDPWIERAKPFQ